MADPAAALKQTRRVLGERGRLAFAVWMAPERNPWAALPGMTLVQRGHFLRRAGSTGHLRDGGR